MASEELLIKLSAYADGELAEEEAREVVAALEAEPDLQQVLDQFRRLDSETAALPVPQLEDDAGEALWEMVADRTVKRTNDAPDSEAEQKTPGDWKDLAAAMPAEPQIGEDRWAKVWSGIQERTGQEEPKKELTPAPSAVESAPLQADFTPVDMKVVKDAPTRIDSAPRQKAIPIWSAALLMSAAAAIMLAVWPGIIGTPVQPDPGGDVDVVEVPEGPEVNDDRYFMLVRHVEGVESEVVCFFEKEDESE